jgi:hypothetical protein
MTLICGPWGGRAGGGSSSSALADGASVRHGAAARALLPSLGARSGRPGPRLRRCIVSPYDRRYRLWCHSLVPLVLFSAWVSPFEFGFVPEPGGALAAVDDVVNAAFAADIALTFFVAYVDRRTFLLQDDPALIAWRYASTWLALDVASTLPTELYRLVLPPRARSYNFFGMLRLWRLHRVGTLFTQYVRCRSPLLTTDAVVSPPSKIILNSF